MQHDIAIVICTVCRESLLRSIRSIYSQTYKGSIQILIGVDLDKFGNEAKIQKVISDECPEHIQTNWINLGYSTSARHGGIHSCSFGGSLRSSLSFLANSQYVMYLDDDDWLAPTHCSDILNSIQGKAWAFAYSIYSDGNNGTPICIDRIESVGVGSGIFAQSFGGFVRPSGLTIDKLKLSHILHLWAESWGVKGDGEDRLIFNELKKYDAHYACTGNATVFYSLDPKDELHKVRLRYINNQGHTHLFNHKNESVR